MEVFCLFCEGKGGHEVHEVQKINRNEKDWFLQITIMFEEMQSPKGETGKMFGEMQSPKGEIRKSSAIFAWLMQEIGSKKGIIPVKIKFGTLMV